MKKPLIAAGALAAAIPDMYLRIAGGDGAPPEKVFSQVLDTLYDRLTMPIVVGSLNRSLLEARKTAEKGTRSVTDRIKDILK